MFPPSCQLKSTGWSSPKLSLGFLTGPVISSWRLLVFASVSVILHLPCLSFCIIPSPLTYYLLFHWKGPWSDNLVKQMFLPSTHPCRSQYGGLQKTKKALKSEWTARWVKWETKIDLKRRGNGIYKTVFNPSFRYSKITKQQKRAWSSKDQRNESLKFLSIVYIFK